MRGSRGLANTRAGDADLVIGPLIAPQTVPGVVFCHAATHTTGTMISPTDRPAAWGLLRAIAEEFPTIVADQGGDSWGNDTGLTAMSGCKTFLQGSSAIVRAQAGPVLLVGVSMGFAVACAWARANLASVAGIAGILSAADLNDLYVNNRGGSSITALDTAYGGKRTDVGCGLTSGSAIVSDVAAVSGDVGKAVVGTGVPAGTTILSANAAVNFTMSANATATNAAASLQVGGYVEAVHGATRNPQAFADELTVPIKLWYADDDPNAVPAVMTAFAAAAPDCTLQSLGNIGGHDTEAAYPGVLATGLVAWLEALA